MPLALVATAGCGVIAEPDGADGRGGGDAAAHEAPAPPPPASSRLGELIATIRRSAAGSGDAEALQGDIAGRLEELESAELEQLAAALAADSDPQVVQLRAAILFDLGEDREAARALADLVIRGVDLLGLFYSWMHAPDPGLATSRYVAISRALLERRGALDAEQRQRADLFLCDETFGGALESCTPDAVRRRLDVLAGRS